MLRRRRGPTPPSRDRAASPGNEFGWRAHEAIQGWTASVDAKASIVVVIESALAGAATRALITRRGELHGAVGLHLAAAITAVTILVLAVASAVWVVFPRLEHRRTDTLASRGLIYFGHLRTRSLEDIASSLSAMTVEEEQRQLASQLRITGQVAWRKHVWLQRSLVLLALGAILLVISFVAF